MLRALVRRPVSEPSRRIRDFYIAHGITPELKFKDLTQAEVLVVATDINHYARLIYGLQPQEGVLDSLLASTAVPPWVTPIERNGQLLMDGGLVSNLPIEPALVVRPKEIIALDVQEHREIPEDSDGFGPLFNKLMNTVQKRQFDLEFAVAAAVRVPVRYIHLYAERPVAVYAFERWEELIERGYSLARYAISRWPVKRRFF
jgi:NTE family protein